MPLTAKIVDNEHKTAWNNLVNNSVFGDWLQLWEWAEIKSVEGWQTLRIGVFDEREELVLACQILYKKASLLGNYAYIPHGPITKNIQDLKICLPILLTELKKIASKYKFFVYEFEPRIGQFVNPLDPKTQQLNSDSSLLQITDPELINVYRENGLILTDRNVQPKHKLYYDLDLDLEKLLLWCEKNTRYNIKLATKKGVKVNFYNSKSPELNSKIEKFYELLLQNQVRTKGYPVRAISTFYKIFETFEQNPERAILTESSYQQEALAMNITQRTNIWSSSFYAASSREMSNLKATYVLRWESIVNCKNSGCKIYDFWGIIPNSKQHEGYTKNKLSFGGIRVDNYGLLALPINKLKFSIWNKSIKWRTKTAYYQHKLKYLFVEK